MDYYELAQGAFGGSTYQAEFDFNRLSEQLKRTRKIMVDGQWHTLPEIAKALGCETQSASARVRDLRKEKYGAHIIERERVEGGLFKYRMKI